MVARIGIRKTHRLEFGRRLWPRLFAYSLLSTLAGACSPGTRAASKPPNATTTTNESAAQSQQSSKSNQCAALAIYSGPAQSLSQFPIFAHERGVLIRPDEDAKVVAEAAAALEQADRQARATDEVSLRVQAVLHELVETLRHIATAIAARDADGYRRNSTRYVELRRDLLLISENALTSCGKRLLIEQSTGRLASEVIQRVVMKHVTTFRACYEAGLARDPKLEGRITVRFMIGHEGRVTDTRSLVGAEALQRFVPEPGTEAFFQALGLPTDTPDRIAPFPDNQVTECVLGQVRQLEFPHPEGGSVTVIYPMVFGPDEKKD